MLLAAAGLRLAGLGVLSFSVDEGVVAYLASFPPGQLLAAMGQVGEVHPPGFFMLVQAVYAWTQSDLILRGLCSVLPSLAMILCFYWLFRDQSCCLEVSWALAISSMAVFYGRELRMYPWLSLWAVIALGCYYRFQLAGSKGWLAGYALAFGAALWFHYFALLLPVTALVWSRTRRFLEWVGATLIALLPWLIIWAPRLRSQLGGQDLELRGRPWFLAIPDWWGRMMVGDVGPAGWPWSYLFAFLGLLFLGVGWSRLRDFREGDSELFSLALCWALTGPVVAFLVSSLTSVRVFEYKYFLFCLPGFAILVLAGLPSAWRWVLLALNLTTLTFLLAVPYGRGQDWRAVATQLKGADNTRVRVLVHPSMMAAPLMHYGVDPVVLTPIDRPPMEDLLKVLDGPDEVWLVTTPHHPFVTQSGLQSFLDAVLERQGVWELGRFLPLRRGAGVALRRTGQRTRSLKVELGYTNFYGSRVPRRSAKCG